MKDDDKLELARDIYVEYAKSDGPGPLDDDWIANVVSGAADHMHGVKIALAAINALSPQLDEAGGLLRACIDGGHSCESEGQLHDAVRAFLAKQGEG